MVVGSIPTESAFLFASGLKKRKDEDEDEADASLPFLRDLVDRPVVYDVLYSRERTQLEGFLQYIRMTARSLPSPCPESFVAVPFRSWPSIQSEWEC